MVKLILELDENATLNEIMAFGVEIGKSIEKSKNKDIVREVKLMGF